LAQILFTLAFLFEDVIGYLPVLIESDLPAPSALRADVYAVLVSLTPTRNLCFAMRTVSHRPIQDASPVDFKLHHYRMFAGLVSRASGAVELKCTKLVLF
jgi:hypothetical protein